MSIPVDEMRVCLEPLPETVTPADIACLLGVMRVPEVAFVPAGAHTAARVRLSALRDVQTACRRNGIPFAGRPIRIYAMDKPGHGDGPPGNRRNLYVLNLPLDVGVEQVSELFSQFGTVNHCVILSMLDAQARRRGFVDMDSAAAAQEAVAHVSGTVWHGYPLEVSYSLVQRSDGPFADAAGDAAGGRAVEISGLLPAATIDEEDLHALIAPYGRIAHVDFPSDLRGLRTYSTTVTLSTSAEAAAACAALDKANVNGQQLHAVRLGAAEHDVGAAR
ncbi:hypothetical protein MSPP1_002385 [Malassezia sp. CBS 17886]|nr:hypothetical protein MSPP1_002385 [Malassezia sp. CBS 17886]